MVVPKQFAVDWLLLKFTIPTKQGSQRVEIWRKLQRYGTVPLGNSGYLLPNNPVNEERFQWLATAIRKYKGDASIVRVQSIDNLSTPQLVGRFAEAREREYQELIRQLQEFSSLPLQKQSVGRLSRLRSRFQEIVEVDFFDSPLQKQFKIRDRRVSVISEIIHDADIADGKFGRKEGYGIDEVLKGWARQGLSDRELLERGMQLIEGLYHSLS